MAQVTKGTTIIDCFNVGSIEALDTQNAENTHSGGIIGTAELNEGRITIANCYSIGTSNKRSPIFHPIFDMRSLFGQVEMVNNYYASEVYGETYDQDLTGDNAKYAAIDVSLEEMKTEAFLKKLNAGRDSWCFVSGVNNGYPVPSDSHTEAVDDPSKALSNLTVKIVAGYLVVEGDYSDINLYNIHGVQLDPTVLLERGVYVVRVTVNGQSAAYKLVY